MRTRLRPTGAKQLELQRYTALTNYPQVAISTAPVDASRAQASDARR